MASLSDTAHEAGRSRTPALALAALGTVYGDIGTSPLYTMREAFAHGRLPLDGPAVLGILSLVFWALVIVVTLKYVTVILEADNRGEGGVLALSALAQRRFAAGPRSRLVVVLAMLGAALFYGDGVITPAISVLSAVEGLEVAAPALDPVVVPVAVGILFLLFFFQRHGTAVVGRFFGPIMCLWFSVLAVLGFLQILNHPDVLRALNPLYAANLFLEHRAAAFVALGAVVLAVTGAEALYADMGHFGRRPIRLAWLGFVLPALLLNYFGQGALLLHQPSAIANPFYLLAPAWALYPMIFLATAATVIASQAVISGAFSLSRQAVQLGYLPRMQIRHTSEREIGQVYVPRINWLLMVVVVAVVIGFGSSSGLASAYGIAVTAAMSIDGVLAYLVTRGLWGWSRPRALAVFGLFMVVDLAFFGATALKIPAGGWFPLALAAGIVFLMSTWRRGRRLLFEQRYRGAVSLASFIPSILRRPPVRVPGTAVFLTANPTVVPSALLHNLKHNKVLHERVVVLTVVTEEVPRVSAPRRLETQTLGDSFYAITLHCGFMEQPDVPKALAECEACGRPFVLRDTSFFLSREKLVPSPKPDLSPWHEQIFIALNHTALDATEFFNIPPDRVIEVGNQIEI